MSGVINYEEIKRLAKEARCNIPELLVLADLNDPFYADVGFRRRRAEWFAGLWERFGFGTGTHVRRVHYRTISQSEPVLMPDGKPYENTTNCAKSMENGARDARYLGLVPHQDFIDQRNSETKIRQDGGEEEAAEVCISTDYGLLMPQRPRLELSRPKVLQSSPVVCLTKREERSKHLPSDATRELHTTKNQFAFQRQMNGG